MSEFSQVLAAIESCADGSSVVVVPQDWLQGRTVFGGLQMALGARAMRAALPESSTALPLRSAQMTFVGPLLDGTPIRLQAQTLRVGRSTAHARCDLRHEDGEVACTVVAIFGGPRESRFVREMPYPPVARLPEEADPESTHPAMVPQFLHHFDLRIATGVRPFSGYAEPRSQIYARLRDRACGREDALLALADVIPTPVLSMLTTPAPASSVNWMIEILRDPAQLDGHAYAVSHQTVAVFG